jgi:outer membrane protein TolC
MKWVERRLSLSKNGKTLRISTAKVLAAETEIPLSSISYIQIGSEEISEDHQLMDEPNKTLNTSPASLFISAGERSVRIRMQQEDEAASLAAELRDLMERAPSIDGGGGGGDDDDDSGDEGRGSSHSRAGSTGGRRRNKSVWSTYTNPLVQQASNATNIQIDVEELDFEHSTIDSRTQQQQEEQRKHIANENLHL